MELLRALAALAEPPRPEQAGIAAALGLPAPDVAAHTEVFTLQLPPYASVYVGADGMLGGAARDRVAGFLRALGIAPPDPPSGGRRPPQGSPLSDADHLALLVGLAADLAERDAGPDGDPRVRHARRALVWEQLIPWLPVYLDAVARLGVAPYDTWAALLDRALRAEAAALGPPPPDAPLHLRAAPALPDPRAESGEAFLAGLLAPVRSGVVLTRADLQHLARDLGLGLRVGERRFVLRALLGQDAPAVLRRVAEIAGEAAQRWRGLDGLGPAGAFWQTRAAAAAALLGDLAADAVKRQASPGTSPGRQKSSISTT